MASLRRTLAHAREKCPWYKERLGDIELSSLCSRTDVSLLPLMDSVDVANYGPRMLCVPQGEVARIVTLQTSGSTGTPKRLHFTRADLDGTVDFFLHGMLSLVDSSDRVLALLPFALPDSTGDLLIRALAGGGVHCAGQWPSMEAKSLADLVRDEGYSCVAGLPQHLLALAEALPFGLVRTMLLCSDYAAPTLRSRIEKICGCETFLHYGTTETGLGGGVECAAHDGCHLRESDLLVEIVDPESGELLPEGQPGEVVVTTLGRQAMPLVRYRTGDLARLTTRSCSCGAITARLYDIAGRRRACVLGGGFSVTSRELDDRIFGVEGLLDYRATLDLENGRERLGIEFLAGQRHGALEGEMTQALMRIPAVAGALGVGTLVLGAMRRVDAFSPSHTLKRSISDQRGSTP